MHNSHSMMHQISVSLKISVKSIATRSKYRNALPHKLVSRPAMHIALLALTAGAEAQAPPQVWVQFVSGTVTATGTQENAPTNSQTLPLLVSGSNSWHRAVAVDNVYRIGYWHGGQAETAAWVQQNSAYPQLVVTERTNVHSYAHDVFDLTNGGLSGSAKSETNYQFFCEDYAYLQLSKNFYGYLDVNGVHALIGGDGGQWARNMSLTNLDVLFGYQQLYSYSSGDFEPAFEHTFYSTRHLVLPGTNSTGSEHRIGSSGGFALWGSSPGRNWHSHESHQNVGNYALPLSQWWVYPVPQETSYPNSIQVIQGWPVSGNLVSVLSSNNNRLTLDCDERKQAATLQFQAQFTTARPDLAMRVYVESNISRPGMIQKLSLLNLQTGQYDVVDTRDATLADAYAFGRTEQLSKYIVSGNNGVTGRITWTPNPKRRIAGTWTAAIDEIRLIGFRR